VIVGNGKDGLPIILGNVDNSSAPPAAPNEPAKERTTAAPPAVATEKTPPDTLSKPSEKMPPTSAEKAKSSQPQEAPRYSYPIPLSLSDLEALVSRLTAAVRSATGETGSSDQNSQKQPPEQQH
jgi:hypothetical protein